MGLVVWNVNYDAELFLRLSISEVAARDGYHSALHPLNYNSGFETVLRRLEVTIRDCGNSIDTYYKQKRLGKISVLPPWFHRTHDV